MFRILAILISQKNSVSDKLFKEKKMQYFFADKMICINVYNHIIITQTQHIKPNIKM